MAEEYREQSLPPTVDQLIDFLDKQFPERSPDIGWSMDKVRHESGKREVVRFCIELRRRRDENIMEQH